MVPTLEVTSFYIFSGFAQDGPLLAPEDARKPKPPKRRRKVLRHLE